MRRIRWRVASFSALCTVVALVFCVALVSCAQPSDSTRLVGTKWVLDSLNAQRLLGNTTITLEFADVTTTLMGCGAAIWAQEEAYARALGSAATYSFEGKGLDLVNRDSGETLRFSRAQP